MKYVDIIIDNNSDHTDNLFTYSCAFDDIEVGDLVMVPFAKARSLKKGYVARVHDELPEELSHVKRFRAVDHIDKDYSLNPESINVISWMKNRYFCRYMDALSCFAPTGKPLKSGKKRELKWEGHDDADNSEKKRPPKLTDEQTAALKKITPAIDSGANKTFLLHGVTGSGKTEIYMQIAEDCIKKNKKVIMLVPEISLTPQTIDRFLSRFGKDRLAVLHSKLSQGERFDQWTSIKKGQVDIVIGARSAVFAPFDNIGAIIVDEEHETSYKSDMTPKYDTIEVAIKRAIQHKSVVILGSATPSVVSNYRAETGLYEKIILKERYNKNPLPQIHIADMRKELASGNKSILSNELYERINNSLANNKQVILFLNRRGYSPFISCRMCGYVMKCPDCGISMTFHKSHNMAVCHFCGKKEAIPAKCPECESKYLKHFGVGTEKVEEVISESFADAKVARLDMDTTSKKGSVNKILNDFKKGKTQILIGTQMVAKGLDFDNVDLVGIIAADVSLNIPDFRSGERTFQLITQVAGRSGRGDEQGNVIIQTYMPENYAVLHASVHDYEAFYKDEILLRKTLSYPPFSDIIQITVLAESEQVAQNGAEQLRNQILKIVPKDEADNILNPNSAPIAKLKNEYRYHIHIKSLPKMRKNYEHILGELKKGINTDKTKGFRVIIEINPYSMY